MKDFDERLALDYYRSLAEMAKTGRVVHVVFIDADGVEHPVREDLKNMSLGQPSE